MSICNLRTILKQKYITSKQMENRKPRKPRQSYVRKRAIVLNVVDVGQGATTKKIESDVEHFVAEGEKAAEHETVAQTEGADVAAQGSSQSEIKPIPVRKGFTENEEDIIIQFYSQNRFLWDHNDCNYKIAVKSASLQELVTQLNNKFTAQEIHHRFSGMRTTYKNNVAKIKKSISIGAGADDIYVPTWPRFDNMTFLDDTVPNRTSLCSFTTPELNPIPEEVVDLTSQSPIFEKLPDKQTNNPCGTSTNSGITKKNFRPTASNLKDKFKKKQEEVVDVCLEVLRSVKDGSSNSTPKDRCDRYGQYVASCLKAMTQWNQTCAFVSCEVIEHNIISLLGVCFE